MIDPPRDDRRGRFEEGETPPPPPLPPPPLLLIIIVIFILLLFLLLPSSSSFSSSSSSSFSSSYSSHPPHFIYLFIYYNAFIGVPLYILNLSNAQSSVHKNSGLRILVRRQLNELSLFSITYNNVEIKIGRTRGFSIVF